MCILDININYGVSYRINPNKKNIIIRHYGAGGGLYCCIGYNLYNAFVSLMNYNINMRDWDISFDDYDGFTRLKNNGKIKLSILKELYKPINKPINKLNLSYPLPLYPLHTIQQKEKLLKLHEIFKQLFQPTDNQLERIKSLKDKYNIDVNNTIGVCYRGTDKNTEVKLAHPNHYIDAVNQILISNPKAHVLIQTDELYVRELFVREFGKSCVFINEIPATDTGIVIHKTLTQEQDVREFVCNVDAAVHILAECKHLVNHTGNTAQMINIRRGSTDNLWEFSAEGELHKHTL